MLSRSRDEAAIPEAQDARLQRLIVRALEDLARFAEQRVFWLGAYPGPASDRSARL
jgi:hypothetical protein